MNELEFMVGKYQGALAQLGETSDRLFSAQSELAIVKRRNAELEKMAAESEQAPQTKKGANGKARRDPSF